MAIDDQDLFSLTMAVASDSAKLARLKELKEAMDAVKAEKAQTEKLVAEMSTRNSDAARHNEQAQARLEKAIAQEAKLLETQRRMGEVQDGIQTEHKAWEKVREQVDAEQAALKRQLAAEDESLTNREREVALQAEDLAKREAVAEGMKAFAERMIARFRAALDDVDPPVEEKPKHTHRSHAEPDKEAHPPAKKSGKPANDND